MPLNRFFMFDNVAFEVVIGLVFIYLLYSLLVTILGEIISTTLGIRARLLRAAVERMLNDGFYYSLEKQKKGSGLSWFRGPTLKEHPDFKKSFAGKFYEYPAIKYLGRIEKEKKDRLTLSKPSYISADYFADALINFLADKGAGPGLMDKVGFCLTFNTYQVQPKTLRQFINLFESSPTIEAYKLNLIKWFNETMDRTSGWHKRKMRLISFLLGLLLAMMFNVDTIKIVRILSTDKEARAQLVTMGIAAAKDSARYQQFVTDNGDTVHAAAILDTGFARVRKDIDAAGMVLGFGWDVTGLLKNDDVAVGEKESSIPIKKYADSLDGLIKKTERLTGNINDSLSQLAINKRLLDSVYADTTIAINEALLGIATNAIDPEKRFSNDTATAIRLLRKNAILQARLNMDSSALAAGEFLKLSLYSAISKSKKITFSVIDSVSTNDKGIVHVYGKRPYNGSEKLGYILRHIFWYSLIGFIITALALSMGAPFWFDLLNKLVSIRGVGLKPEEKKVLPPSPADVVLMQKDGSVNVRSRERDPVADVVEAAYQIFAPQIKAVPGVKSVFSVTKNLVKSLQVNVNGAAAKAEVERLFARIAVGEVVVPITVINSGTPSNHIGGAGMITNRSGINGFGSLGCIVVRRETGSKHILSCWHVLKGDLNYSGSDNEPFIIDRDSDSLLAERWAGGIRDQFDYGLARCNEDSLYKDNTFLKTKLGIKTPAVGYRFVSRADVEAQIPVRYFNALTGKVTKGFIYTESDGVDINYIDKTRTIKDVLLLTNDEEQTISAEGNSGAVVFDDANKAIAMIIGGDLKYTYAVKLSHIFRMHSEMDIA